MAAGFRAMAACLGALLVMAAWGGVAAQQPGQPAAQGCLAAGTCGKKGTTPAEVARDYWQNWVCTECHTGPAAGVAPSPQERALIAIPSRFWDMHADAARDGETRARLNRHRAIKDARALGPEFRRLIADQPRRR
ncbi:MAG TPA: hypothetical protein VGB90_02020 [Alphaproteobacteria bacterium]